MRARGLSARAERGLRESDVTWADVILVMDCRHRTQLLDRFGDLVDPDRVHVLDIPDEYVFMDPELVEELRTRAGPILDAPSSA